MAKLTENEYTTIKQLLGKGYEGLKVAEIVGRGRGLISAVNNTASYKEFVERGKAARAKYRNKYKAPVSLKAQQLPLDTPKKTTLDLREDLAIKLNAFRDAIVLYKHTATGSSAVKQIRYCQKAQERLEEAWLWLKESF